MVVEPRTIPKMLKQRIVTALVLLIAFICASTLLSPFAFSLVIAVVVFIAAWEWVAFIGLGDSQSKWGYLISIALLLAGCFPLLGVTPTALKIFSDRVVSLSVLGLVFWVCAAFIVIDFPKRQALWNKESKIAAMGIFTLLPTWAGVVQLKYFEPSGFLVLSLVILVAAVDVGAYFAGVNFGKTKLAEQLSPNKTWEGVWGGVGLCLVAVGIFSWLVHSYFIQLGLLEFLLLVVMAGLMSFFSVIGDLLESMLKRNRDIKDSGKILPGHGGVLDRVDGLLAATPLFVLSMTFILLEVL